MKKIKVVIFVLACIFVCSACKQKPIDHSNEPFETPLSQEEAPADEVPEKNAETEIPTISAIPNETTADKQVKPEEAIKKHLQELTKNGSRKWGTKAEVAAAKYLAERMEAYGYTVFIQEFPAYKYDLRASKTGDYFDINPYNSEVIGKGYNVIADINLNKNTDRFLVLCAHYDTVSEELGIIDNTSGVVTLMEAARQISDTKLPYNLRFIFFSSEERYLLGSKYYVLNLTEKELNQIIACINVDMVGYKDGQEIVVATPDYVNLYSGSSSLDGVPNTLTDEWNRIFPEHNTYVKGETSSDHYSFEKKGLPNMMITQKHFDLETVRKHDSDFENLSIVELETTINMLVKYVKNLDITKIN